MTIRRAYLDAATVAVGLLAEPAVAASWEQPSALPRMTVGGLAAHLALQITRVPGELDAAVQHSPIELIDHYGRSTWVGADINNESNTGIRRLADDTAAPGPAAVLARAGEELDRLRDRLPGEPGDRLVHRPAWALSLDDVLVTRLLEITVHCDDLAVSVGVPTPELPGPAVQQVLDLLVQLAVRRHGTTAVLRTLSRAERAPATIAAI